MKKHKYFIRFLVFWHIFMSAFALLLFVTSMNNHIDPYFSLHGEEIIVPLSDRIEWYLFTWYLLLIFAITLASGLCLLIKKNWGRILSIIAGIVLIPFGIYLFIGNFFSTVTQNPTLLERIEEYWITMGASLNYIEITAIMYGIFAIIYFTRKGVISFTSCNTKPKDKLVIQPES